MKPAISKYKKSQESVTPKKKKKPSSGPITLDEILMSGEAMKDESFFEDKIEISEDAAKQLAEAALAEDLEMKLDEVIKVEENVIAKTMSASVSPVAIERPKIETKGPKEKMGTKEEIIKEYAPLIKFIAQKIAARLPANIELDDLISSGTIGLMDAIDKYDPSRDNKFKTYAEFRVRGAILDELRAQDWVPRSVREKAKMLERLYARIENERGRPANEDDVCQELKITKEEYYELLNEVRSISLLSYDDISSISKGDRRGQLEYAESSKAPTPYSEVTSHHIKKLVSEAINDLPEKQRLVLSLYYYEDLNLKSIGKVLDVTESRVSQLHTQAILRLKAKLKNHFDDFVNMFA